MGGRRKFLSAALFGLAFLLAQHPLGAPRVHAGGKIAIDETKWISLGAGGRFSITGREDNAPSGDWSTDFNFDNARIYINGQIHEYVKFEFNTECVFCGNSDLEEFVLLDGVAKIEPSPYFNIWGGRLIVPAERREMNGPFFSNTYDAFRTPFFPSDFSTEFGTGGAGVYARDHGVNIWGAYEKFQYVVGVFAGLQSSSNSGPNQDDNPLWAGRFAYNFLEQEKNPGYYTSGGYFGGGGDILTLATAFQYQEDGSGSMANPGDFFGLAVDLLFEKPIADVGTITFDAEYKYFDADYDEEAFTDGTGNFGIFDGNSFSLVGLFMFPQEIGIGKFQPYLRYTGVYPDNSSDRAEFEVGLNYVIDGYNARVSFYYQYGDLRSEGLNYAPDVRGDEVNSLALAIQLQI